MRAGFEPCAAHQRLGGQGGAGDDVGRCRRLGEIGHGSGRDPGGGEARREGSGLLRIAAPDQGLADRPRRAMRRDQIGRQRAGADHQMHSAVRSREIGGGERRGRGGTTQRQRRAVEHRTGIAGRGVKQQIGAVDRRQRAARIVGKHGDDLDPERVPVRHAGISSNVPGLPSGAGRRDRVMMARRHLAAVAKHRPQRLDQARKIEQAMDRLGVDDKHRRGPQPRAGSDGGRSAGAVAGRRRRKLGSGRRAGGRQARSGELRLRRLQFVFQRGHAALPLARLAPPMPSADPGRQRAA